MIENLIPTQLVIALMNCTISISVAIVTWAGRSLREM